MLRSIIFQMSILFSSIALCLVWAAFCEIPQGSWAQFLAMWMAGVVVATFFLIAAFRS